jgi:basic membrane protein A
MFAVLSCFLFTLCGAGAARHLALRNPKQSYAHYYYRQEESAMRLSRFRGTLFTVPMLILTLLLAACGTTTTGGTSTTTPKAKFQVGLVTDIGGLNDQGFNQLAYAGYTKAEKQYGFKESVIQTQSQNDYINNLTTAAQTNDLVIAVGFLMQTPLDQVAKQFPTKNFAIVDGCATPPNSFTCDPLKNVTPLFFKEQQPGCLAGVVAGKMEADGKSVVPKLQGGNAIGAVGGIEVPAVDRYIAGYKFCAQKVDPTVSVVVTFANSFTDTAKCSDAANAQISQKKADFIFQVAGGCGIGALDAAAKAGVFGIGVDADQNYIHPDSVVTSALKKVDVAVYTIIDLTEKGNYPTDPTNFAQFDIKNGGVGYGKLNSAVPADVQPVLDKYIADMTSGALVPPTDCMPATTCASS